MPWIETTRPNYDRRELRYASDLRDDEWPAIARFMPEPNRLGRPREVDLREVVNGIFYIMATGCQWRMLPKDFPPYSTVQGYFYQWRDDGTWARIVERTFAWLGRNSRLAKDFEKLIDTAIAWVLIAHIKLLTRRLTKA